MNKEFDSYYHNLVCDSIWRWINEYYKDYHPKRLDNNKFSIWYERFGCKFFVIIELLEHLKQIKYTNILPINAKEDYWFDILCLINNHHKKSVIGRCTLRQEIKRVEYSYWYPYSAEGMNFDSVDKGIGFVMICGEGFFREIEECLIKNT